MENGVKRTEIREGRPERRPEQGSGGKEEWQVEEVGGRLGDPMQGSDQDVGSKLTEDRGSCSCRWIWVLSPA